MEILKITAQEKIQIDLCLELSEFTANLFNDLRGSEL